MANDTRKQTPVELSALPTLEDAKGFWIFGSRTNADGTMESGKCLYDNLEKMQLERRISLTLETLESELFIGEEMTIYKVESLNVDTLSIDNETVSTMDYINKKIEKCTKVKFTIERMTSDPTAYLYIYAKAELP